MNHSSPTPPVPEDVQYFDEAVALIKRIYAMHGSLNPLAMVHSYDAGDDKWLTHFIEAPALNSREEKDKFIAGIQHAGISLDSKRAVLVLESYAVLPQTPEAIELQKTIHQRGGSLREHPDHFEAVAISLESDWGSISQTFRINRMHEQMVELLPAEDQHLCARDDKNAGVQGILTGFHVPSFVRESEEGKAFARMLAGTFDTSAVPIKNDPGAKSN